MTGGYLALYGPEAKRAIPGQRALLAQLGYQVAYQDQDLLIFALAGAPVRACSGLGVLVGRLFRKTDDIDDPRSVQDLLTNYWGSYVAFLPGPEGIAVLRDPSGALPCFSGASQGLQYATDQPRLLLDVGLLSGEIDWTFVVQDLAFKRRRGRRTGLLGLDEIAPGELRAFAGSATLAWSPWRFTASSQAFSTLEEAAAALATAVDDCVNRLAQDYDRLLLELSGGLDSSIVAAAMHGDTRVRAFNAASADPEGDEKDFAAHVARLNKMTLVFHTLDAGEARLPSPGRNLQTARPGRLGVLAGLNAALATEARETGATAFIGGMGGDSVFFATNSAAPIADRLVRRGPSLGLIRTGLDVARLNNATVWAAAKRAWSLLSTPRLADDRGLDLSFLRHVGPLHAEQHSWMAARPRECPPGRERHVASIAFMMGFLDGHAQRNGLDQLSPLLAQPVIETALRTPSWFSVDKGQDRAVARAAFADRLPDSVRFRRSKGAIDRYVDDVVRANQTHLGDLLLDGVLDRHGLLDAPAIRAALKASAGLTGERGQRLLFLADAELWARSWTKAA